jgi:hypothetical protein
MGPVLTPTGVSTEIELSVVAKKLTPLRPLKQAFVAVVKWVPEIVTVTPEPPIFGKNPVMYGPGPIILKEEGLLLVPD